MSTPDPQDVFLNPQTALMRRYEALRARYVDGCSTVEAAQRFGYAPGSFRNLCSEFIANPTWEFFEPPPPATADTDNRQQREQRDQLIVELRKQRQLSINRIAEEINARGIAVSVSTVGNVLRRAGHARLPRRPSHLLSDIARPATAPVSDVRKLDLSARKFTTPYGGLFLFLPYLAQLDFERLVQDHAMPGSRMIPARNAFLALLALKLWDIGRPSQAMPEVFDEGLALFAGLNAFPKRSTLTEYSCRVDPRTVAQLMAAWLKQSHRAGLAAGDSFDLDFHTIPYHGDDALMERHYVSKRSRRQRGILAFVAKDDEARVSCYANAKVRKADQNDEIVRFAEYWRQNTGKWPRELVFDSRLTTYANLARLNELGIGFITLRRRSAKIVDELLTIPRGQWQRITLTNVGRAYRNPRILERRIRLSGYPDDIRQLAIIDLGHEKPTLLITNQMDETPARLVDRYARRMVIENTIATAIDFFHMDALSASVPLKIEVDLQLTLMAQTLYRLFAEHVGHGHQLQYPRTVFRKFIHASAEIVIDERTVTVRFGRRANNPYLVKNGFSESHFVIPWLGHRQLRFAFR